MSDDRALPGDWYAGRIPENVEVDPTAYIETTYSFREYRSRLPQGLRMGRGASVYLGAMFDVGAQGRVILGDYAMLSGGRVICDERIELGDYALISWNVVLMDGYRLPMDPVERRAVLQRLTLSGERCLPAARKPRPLCIGRNVWIGFDACVLPGVSIGEGAIVGARSVVTEDVPPYSVVAGNPARLLRRIDKVSAQGLEARP